MKKSEKLQTGDIVFLRSDVKGEYPMTIVGYSGFDTDNSDLWEVCWINKQGHVKYADFPGKILKKSENLK
ncbi:hypothetical protein SDC9_17959 [bioreactor metagenome]|uniref:DUF2158 domain-containing protein n=1 Tax=bioreactor metagenome TaxID=1076179 RepID=A0A644TZT8_9ZZZZ|nr:hypothetical protein [Lentimicrobium sp.]MEA5110953.1 hypothetical protein [Lentimicrobium sp.]